MPVEVFDAILAWGSTSHETIVLVHGFWVAPRSWENWITHYERKGHQVVAPAYPGFEVEVEALNADPAPIAEVTVPEIIAHLEEVVRSLPEPPIVIGHSAGGAVLKSPANRHKAVGLTFEQWRYAFTNTFSKEEARALYERYHIPASGGILWGGLLANFQPGHQDTWVDYHNDQRAPLLFVSGSADHVMPPAVQESNARHYRSATITERREYTGYAHLLPAQPGWEQIADEVLDWALRHAR